MIFIEEVLLQKNTNTIIKKTGINKNLCINKTFLIFKKKICN